MNDTPIYDSLTGAYTRALLHDQLHAEVERVRRYGQMCSLLLFDLDHFKSVNDAFGHARGDQVLVEVARRVRQTTRASDQFFRYGGDEFVVLLPNTAKAEATRLAERLLDAVRSEPFGGTVLLRRLSVFAGGWTIAAAEAVCSRLPADVAETLTQLVGKSLVVLDEQAAEPRYRMLETIRMN